MITKQNFKSVLEQLDFKSVENDYFYKTYAENTDGEFKLAVRFENTKVVFEYPDGVSFDRKTTVDDHQKESYVVFECVARLFDVGYKPENITLEGLNYEGQGQGYIDILVKDGEGTEYLIIECKRSAEKDKKDDEFEKHWKRTLHNGDQLFRYFNTYSKAQFLCLYTADFIDEKLANKYHVITLKDNDEYLRQNKKFKSYQTLRENQGSKEEFFEVWKNTYLLDYSTNGIFEAACKPFDIGHKKYSVADLKEIDSVSMQKKYNAFATILRKYNVSSKENAFDKLINLFLAKIVDETNNQSELKYLWKGAAYDNYFDMQDRLLELYKIGMEKFFKEEVAYVENDEIENAFKFLKNTSEEDVAKKTILEYFRILKYFNNNPFAFLDVHNERLFYQNAVILKEVVNMVQDIKIKTEEQNQFLGDLFEGFLDQGFKQSEGQFFTPLPIVRFLISALPLDKIIKDSADLPKVIDYACGAGHFLTEYANQIKPIVQKYKKAELEDYYENICGIEKEYRLSKVSQVSTFMYGQNGIKILYHDALEKTSEVQDGTYSVLVANPPYSVKGFLETLSEEERSRFELFNNDINIATNDSIETFFVERAAQLLKKDGLAALILPSSVLSNGNIYIKCREIILKYFDLVAIFESGSGTFGKTGTNTATLFLRRREDTPSISEQYANRVNSWFSGNFDYDRVYEDFGLVEKYCAHQNYDLASYKKFLTGKLADELLQNEIFADYKKTFENDTTAKNIREKKITPKYSEEDKNSDLEKYVFSQMKGIEKNKLYFFMLSSVNQNVLAIKSPSNNKEMKKFLGYRWSGRKGDEGIKYINVIVKEKKDGETEDDTIEQIKGIAGIQTPLFNPQNFDDEDKLNTLVRKNFNQVLASVPETLEPYAKLVSLTDMLDFSRTTFDKAIKTNVQKKVEIKSKFPLVKLGEVAHYVSEKIDFSTIAIDDYISTDNMLQNRKGVEIYSGEPNIERITKYEKDDILVSNIRPYLKKIWFANKNGGCSNDVIVFRVLNKNSVLPKFLFETMSQDIFFDFMMTGKKGIKMPRGDKNTIPNFKIPLPPLDVQKSIIAECEKVDAYFANAQKQIEDAKQQIAEIMQKTTDLSPLSVRLGEVAEIKGGDTFKEIYQGNTNSNDIPFFKVGDMNTVGNETVMTISNNYVQETILRNTIKAKIFNEGTIVFPKVGMAINTNKKRILGRAASIDNNTMAVWTKNEEKLLQLYLYYHFVANVELKNIASSSNPPSISATNLALLQIPLPSLTEQQKIVSEVQALEQNISTAKNVLSTCPARKAEILRKHLM